MRSKLALALVLVAASSSLAFKRDTSSTSTCSNKDGSIVVNNRGWFSTASGDQKVTWPVSAEGAHYSVSEKRGSPPKMLLEVEREGYYGPIKDQTYTQDYVVEQNKWDYVKSTNTKIGEPVAVTLLCRGFSGEDREMSYIGPLAKDEQYSAILRQFEQKYPTSWNPAAELSAPKTISEITQGENGGYRVGLASVTIPALKLPVNLATHDSQYNKTGWGFTFYNGQIVARSSVPANDRRYCTISLQNYVLAPGEDTITIGEQTVPIQDMDSNRVHGKFYYLDFSFGLKRSSLPETALEEKSYNSPYINIECLTDFELADFAALTGGRFKLAPITQEQWKVLNQGHP